MQVFFHYLINFCKYLPHSTYSSSLMSHTHLPMWFRTQCDFLLFMKKKKKNHEQNFSVTEHWNIMGAAILDHWDHFFSPQCNLSSFCLLLGNLDVMWMII